MELDSESTDKDPSVLIRFSRRHHYLIAALLALFLLFTSLHLHGYSLPILRNVIDHSPPQEVLLGKVRPVRSDDFRAVLPFMFSQAEHSPSFPVVNSLIGEGHNMFTNYPSPVRHWLTVFRPQLWGYFIGIDYGISWNWWFRVLGLFYSFFLVFMLISHNRFYLSLFASLALLFAPFFQFWSFYSEPVSLFMGLCFVFASHVLFSKSKGGLFLHSLLLGWAGGAFLFCLYPPYEVVLAYLFLSLWVGYLLNERKRGNSLQKIPLRCLGLLFSILIVGLAS